MWIDVGIVIRQHWKCFTFSPMWSSNSFSWLAFLHHFFIVHGYWTFKCEKLEKFAHFCTPIVLIPEEMATVSCLNLKKAHNGKGHNEKIELPFIVKQLISDFIIQCKPSQGKENEWTHLQTCHWVSKCQIRPNLSCLDEWQALGRVSLCLLSFPIKKSQIPHERVSLPDWSQSCCFIQRKTGL